VSNNLFVEKKQTITPHILVSGSSFLASTEKANHVKKTFQADGFDMEGFGLVALEAAVMGKIVLVSDLEGMKDAIINGKNGYRIPSGNAQMWADAIHHHIENHTLTGEDIKAFTTQNYSWEKMCRAYIDEMKKM
jgi:glycosyltransferase involved in cell wall biosynthesis